MKTYYWIICALCFTACTKKGGGKDDNHKPTAAIKAEMTSTNPITFQFNATAYDQDGDPLIYTWDFGEGTLKQGGAQESFSYEPEKEYTVKLTVDDGKSAPTTTALVVNTKTTTVSIDATKTFQTIDGFGGFGAQREYWSNGPFTSDTFVKTLINDLGLTILRDNIPTSFEVVNDNNDPFVTNLSGFNLNTPVAGHDGTLNDHLEFLRAMKEAGLHKFVVSIWSPAPWMKHNNKVGNGTQDNSAPPYTTSPTDATNQLKIENYDEFAEMCVAYIKIIKQQTGLDVYALSVQNEPRFSQFYASAVYNGNALRDLVKVVGKRFKDEGISTKLFLPEDIGWVGGVESMVKPTLDDPEARQYADIIAVHGYDLDGVTAASPSAQTWQTMHSWGAAYNKPLWMTETSGFANTHKGAIDLAKAMYTALRFGNASAWLFWSLSTSNLDEYSLMNTAGAKSKRYYVSKNFYRYIRPGAVRIDAAAPEISKLYPLAFQHVAENSKTIVIINDNETEAKAVRLAGAALASQYKLYATTATDNAAEKGIVQSNNIILIPANSVVTLYSGN
jgi:O-glycosyl hydrolase